MKDIAVRDVPVATVRTDAKVLTSKKTKRPSQETETANALAIEENANAVTGALCFLKTTIALQMLTSQKTTLQHCYSA
jgi:hypothetical protein